MIAVQAYGISRTRTLKVYDWTVTKISMRTLDLIILFAYLIGTVLFGSWFSRRQRREMKDYFVSSQSMPWWAIMASVVSTETSSLTFVSVPGVAFTGNFTFLQLVVGYLIGRMAVTLIFVPLYFRGELMTVYQLLGQRFGSACGGWLLRCF